MRSGILPGHRDETVRPQDDLFGHANGTLGPRDRDPRATAAATAPSTCCASSPTSGCAHIIERAAADAEAAEGSPTRKVGDLYRSFMDEARAEALGLAPDRGRPGRDRSGRRLRRAVPPLGRLQRQGGPGLFDFGVAPDAKDPERVRPLPRPGRARPA